MDCMVLDSNGTMCIVIDNVVLSYVDAFNKFPERAQAVAGTGVFDKGGVFLGKYYFKAGTENVLDLYVESEIPVEVSEDLLAEYGLVLTEMNEDAWVVKSYSNVLLQEFTGKYTCFSLTQLVKEVLPVYMVPKCCRGETWAITTEEPDEEIDDIYCIENNWEKRDSYYIADNGTIGVRYVHSDALACNFEFPISECEED